ncbi:hypothetical protein [Ochrobactrum sp. AN78]|uniref:hypothetical protein n=1 Tax=Ochrobactrum sp. AN78 TaxID=3039853 RepID=UPI002989AEF2|nr:hypothetical protein [Ochrobactrum sp. AN78]MDH7789164.1 hypothetical protein [Ochrobactrum sp. AN78]
MSRILNVLAGAEQGGACTLLQDEIAKKASVSVRSLRDKLTVMEALGVILRTRQTSWGVRGRANDVILLSTERDFNLPREIIRNATSKANFAAAPKGGFTGKFAGAPTHVQPVDLSNNSSILGKDAPYIYGDVVDCINLGAKVYLDSSRNRWRALVVLDGVEFDCGRHESMDLAQAEIMVSISEIVHAHTHKTGSPINPSTRPSLLSLSGAELFDFLFGTGAKHSNPHGPRSGPVERVWGIIPQWGAGAKPRNSNVAELSAGARA